MKRYDVRRSQPATIFIGYSRIKQSMDPKLVTKTDWLPGYNGGLNRKSEFFGKPQNLLQTMFGQTKFRHHLFVRDWFSTGSTRQ